MSDHYDKELLLSGIREAKAGNKEAARQYFERAAHASQDEKLIADAWFGVSQMTENEVEKRRALKNCLASDPGYVRAHRSLAALDEKLKANQIVASGPLSPTPKASEKVERALCPKCGKRMSFTPDGKSLICEHCARQEKSTSQPGKVDEKDFAVAMAITHGQSKPLDQPVFHCEDCGSQFILSPNQSSFTCTYCGSARLVSRGSEQQLLAPDRIVPHAFAEKHAAQLLVQWVKERRIKPEKQVGQPRGVYLPLWTFNLGGLLDYTSEKTETVPAGVKGTYIRKTHLKACYPVQINDLSIPALRKLSGVFQKLTSSFDLKAALPFDPRYLADCPASVYDLPLAEASLNARAKTVSRYKRELPDRLDMKILSTSSSRVTILSFHLDLLPVWITEISIEGQKYLVLIDGKNGSIASDLPEKSGVMKFISGLLDG